MHGITSKASTTIDLESLPPLLTVAQAAQLRGNSEKFVRDMLRAGRIKGSKIGASWRVNRDAFLAQCGLR